MTDLARKQEQYRQGEFLRRNHHLISPWMYTPEQYAMRNIALARMNRDVERLARGTPPA